MKIAPFTVSVSLLLFAASLPAEEIRHRFLAKDESRDLVLYVDQRDPSKDWTLKLTGGKHRDIQLVGQNRLMLSSPDGYREFDLADRRMVKEVKGYPGGTTARRLPDGRTILAANQKGAVAIRELGPDDKLLREALFKGFNTRLVRRTPQDTLLFGSGNHLVEGNWKGEIVRQIALKQGVWVYQALRRPDGHLWVAGGYDPTLFELAADGKVLRALGGKDSPEGKQLGFHFLGNLQVLKNGNVVICNWTGHGPNDGAKGVQIVEYDPAGHVVWKWQDAQRAGSIHAVIVLDDLDTAVLNDDVTSVLGPVK